MTMFMQDDGGRSAAGFQGRAGDCVARAVAIASGRPYAEVYAALADVNATTRARRGSKRGVRSARDGVSVKTEGFRRYMASLGATWRPLMAIGSGCTVHVRPDELPATGRHVLALSKHYAAWVDGVLRDTYDCSRGGTRCVYGVWTFP